MDLLHRSCGLHVHKCVAQGVIGAAMGCLMCYGSKVGWYHRVFLPVIVLELAAGGGSIWGAIDLCALCMVAAGTRGTFGR